MQADVTCRRPTRADAPAVHALVQSCPPLDVNSVYAYLLLCTHFAETSVVAYQRDTLVGFTSAYRKPATPEELFIWQVAVAPAARGRGVGARMLRDILSRDVCRHVRYVEATVAPSNRTSHRLFQTLTDALHAACHITIAFSPDDFGNTVHDAEQLVRIGPLTNSAYGEQ